MSCRPARMMRASSCGPAMSRALSVREARRSKSSARSRCVSACWRASTLAKTSASSRMRPSNSAGHSRSRRKDPKVRLPRRRPATHIGMPTCDFRPMRCQVALSTAASDGTSSRRAKTTGRPARARLNPQGLVCAMFSGGVRSMPSRAHECVLSMRPVSGDTTISEQRSMSSASTMRRSASSIVPSMCSDSRPMKPADSSDTRRSKARNSALDERGRGLTPRRDGVSGGFRFGGFGLIHAPMLA